jgi:hypothetical protein
MAPEIEPAVARRSRRCNARRLFLWMAGPSKRMATVLRMAHAPVGSPTGGGPLFRPGKRLHPIVKTFRGEPRFERAARSRADRLALSA